MSQTVQTSFVKIILELGKARISLPVALSALTGYVIHSGTVGLPGLYLFIGVFLFSCSSGALNHWQEHRTDALMPRTQNRPIPSGQITPGTALLVALGYALAGSLMLLLHFPPVAWLAALVTLISYNALYTPLKKVTAFAVVPGSLVGALPPYIGWLADGGFVTDPIIFWVATFFFIGQIPHFWLLLLMFGKEYSLAGYPSLHNIFSENQIKRLSFTWILATIASALLIAMKVLIGKTTLFILLFYVFYLLFSTTIELFSKKDIRVRPTFFKLNFLYLFMMIALIVDGLFHR
ncbi:protoheme IX farnesyltransferase [Mangrovibacterium marinum]|uniref:heme o synthase n=1 Tax=Mangrovibacterium marinum TaxID=1639118 RepID=A0A2T5C2C6_9BACT|nr:protoheme IX farnesyltransferase [Mangrovibacterium marinum]PTN08852.1 protoheme IX farnesyltransferase [Mangrovibacterium marinum]